MRIRLFGHVETDGPAGVRTARVCAFHAPPSRTQTHPLPKLSQSVVSIAGSEENETSMERLHREHYRALVCHARRWVGSHDAEDIVQDAFRYCWERINGEGMPRRRQVTISE